MEFLRESIVYLFYSNTYYRLHVQNIMFNQTFKQKGSKKKTLHSSTSLIEGSEINEANPAQFELELFMMDESSTYQHKALELLLKNDGDTLSTFDLLIDVSKAGDSPRTMYKLDTCVLETASFQIVRSEPLVLSLGGSAKELTTIAYASIDEGDYDNNPTYSFPAVTTITVDGTILDQVTGVNLEIQNEIEWVKNNTLQKSLSVTNSAGTTYPESFVLKNRSVAGNITTYVGDSHPDLQTWKEDIEIRIQAGLASNNYQLDAQLTPCSFTNRVNPTEVFTQGYDFRMIGHPADLNTLLTY